MWLAKTGDVLDASLAIFNCDRVFLVHPCDPEATEWSRLPTRLGDREAHPRVTEILSLPHGRLLAHGR